MSGPRATVSGAHGTVARYSRNSDPCRCPACRAAMADYQRERRRARRGHQLPDTVEHGASAYLNWGCRCPVCTTAILTSLRNYQERLSEAAEQ